MSEMASESLLNFVGKYTKNDREVAVCQRRGYRMESWTYARIIGQANRVARELEVGGWGRAMRPSRGAPTQRNGSSRFSDACFVAWSLCQSMMVRLCSSRSESLERLKQSSCFERMRIRKWTPFLPFPLNLLGK